MELKFPYPPRPGQPQAVEDLASFLDSPSKLAILVEECGWGKELVMALTVLNWVSKGGKAVWLTAKGATGEWNKRKELEACLSVNPIPVTVAFLRAKEDTCPYRLEWAKQRGVKPPPAIEFCAVARAKCRFYKNFIKFSAIRDATLLNPIEQNTIGSDKIGQSTQSDRTGSNDYLKASPFIDESLAPVGVCPYYFLRNAVKRADVVIADYNYAIHPIIRTVILKAHPSFMDGKTLLLFDEAHLLAERARGTIRGRLSTTTLTKALDEVRGKFLIKKRPDLLKTFRVDESAVKALQRVRRRILHLVKRKSMEIKREFEVTQEEKAKILYYDFMDKRIEDSIELLEKTGEWIAKFKFNNDIGVISWTLRVAGFLKRLLAFRERRWMLLFCGRVKPRRGRKKHPYVALLLLDPRVSVAKVLRLCGKVIFYSGTLDDENLVRVLRIREYEPFKGYPSPFPMENRLDVFVSYPGKIIKEFYETDEGAQRVCEGILRWFEGVKGGRSYVVMTKRLYERATPLLKERGLKTRMVPLKVPKRRREREIEASFMDPAVSVSLSPYSWAGSSCDIRDCVSVLTVGIPVARLTLERRQTIEYYRRMLAKEDGPHKAAWLRIAIIPALENAVQAAERARRFKPKDRIVHVWMDERYARKRGYHGRVEALTGAENVEIAQTLDEMETVLGGWLKQNPTG